MVKTEEVVIPASYQLTLSEEEALVIKCILDKVVGITEVSKIAGGIRDCLPFSTLDKKYQGTREHFEHIIIRTYD